MSNPTTEEEATAVKAFDLDKASENLPMIYFNGFTIAFSGSDFSLILKLDNKPAHLLKASYTVAKSFALDLQKAVKSFETATNHNVMTIKDVDESLKKTLGHKE